MKQHANLAGSVYESDALRGPFLRWIGKRSNAAGLKVAGLDYTHGMRWLAGGVLRTDQQEKARAVLSAAGVV